MRTRLMPGRSNDRKAIDQDISQLIRLFDVSSNQDIREKYCWILYKIETSAAFFLPEDKRNKFNHDIINRCMRFLNGEVNITIEDIIQLKFMLHLSDK